MFPSRRIATMGGEGVPEWGYSLKFNGTSDYLELPASFEDDSFTIYTWVKMAESPNADNKIIFDNRDDARTGYVLYNGANEEVYCLRMNSNAGNIRTLHIDEGETPGAWTHFSMATGSGSGVDARLRKNGSTYDNSSQGVTTSISGSTSTIGARNFSSIPEEDVRANFWNSNIAEVAIYSDFHNTTDTPTIYNSGQPFNHKSHTNLWAWYRMGNGTEQGQGTKIYDMSGNGHHATMAGGMDETAYVRDNPWNI